MVKKKKNLGTCKYVLASGKRKGLVCGGPVSSLSTSGTYCGNHRIMDGYIGKDEKNLNLLRRLKKIPTLKELWEENKELKKEVEEIKRELSKLKQELKMIQDKIQIEQEKKRSKWLFDSQKGISDPVFRIKKDTDVSTELLEIIQSGDYEISYM
jgi:uncharacterized protein (DUF342 family)